MKGFNPTGRRIFWTTAAITHIWSVVIAYQEYGLFGAVISFLLPGLSEMYWMFTVFGGNDLYAYISLTHILLSILYAFWLPKKKKEEIADKDKEQPIHS